MQRFRRCALSTEHPAIVPTEMVAPTDSPASTAAGRAPAPRVSVLLPTYRYARFLSDAIESVLTQDLTDFELIISDDASKDGSAEIIRHYAQRDSRIRATVQPQNLGMVANWNWCLQRARGHYVKFLFGDDLLASPHALSKFARLLDAHPEARLASSARLLIDANSQETGEWNELTAGVHAGPVVVSRCLRDRRNYIGEPTAVMFRREPAPRGFDPTFKQIVDMEFWFHLLPQGALIHTDATLCAFRRHEAQQTALNNHARVSDHEIQALTTRYLDVPALQAQVGRGTFARRQILYRQWYYFRKARLTASPENAATLAEIKNQLPWPWMAVCWMWHRVSRPLENFKRRFQQQAASARLARVTRKAGNSP